MAIPEPLLGFYEDIRRYIDGVDGYSVQLLYKNVESNLENIRGYVADPNEINGETSAVLRNALIFSTVYHQSWMIGEAGAPRIATARTALIDALDGLGTILETVRLSGKARSLGL